MLTDDGIKSQFRDSDGGTGVVHTIEKAMRDERLLRNELFSGEQRREHGKIAAGKHRISERNGSDDKLLARLEDNENNLRSVHRKLIDDVTAKKPINPVAEWLVDNFYVIEEQVSLARRHLPKTYLRELPQLDSLEIMGIPRIYEIAELIVSFGDGRIATEDICAVLAAYQEITPLKLGELWATPIMLRLALIENIRRISALIFRCANDQDLARKWAEQLIDAEEKDPKNIVIVLADMARTNPPLSASFVAELKRLLQGRGSGMKLPLQWVEQSLNEHGHTTEQLVNDENHSQAALEISMRNCINSLRYINSADWRDFVENMSVVEDILRKDPAGVYESMDFHTRDAYRRAVETMARKSRKSEADTARKCLELAGEGARADGDASRRAHVGYYLISDGHREMKDSIGFHGGVGDFLRDASSRATLALYLGSIFSLTTVFTVFTALIARAYGVHGWMLAILSVLLVFCTGHVAIGLVNFLATVLVKPRPLPRLNFEKGIPVENRTLVVVPVIISSESGIKSMLRRIESHYLNNRGKYTHFGLLTDFADASSEHAPADEALLRLCRNGIRKLNERYIKHGGDNFYLFHRARVFNPHEGLWMGHERKRGKLEDLVKLLVRGDSAPFSAIEGKRSSLANVRYVITLDADTLMARDSAWQMVGTMAHPLIRPVYDEKVGRVVSGHGILQPRVDSRLSGAIRSAYARMCATEIGIDPYTTVSSDVYQDLFDEGSFIGKGIFDVRTFDRALGGRFPDNKILSHDLLEGCVARSGLLGDIKLYEDPPSSYMMDIFRRRRWVRGDWQIASYLVSRETRKGFRRTANPLSLLSQWKIFDNLRRSLTPFIVLMLLIFGLTMLAEPWLYLLIVCAVFFVPIIINSMNSLVRKSPDNTIGQHISSFLAITGHQTLQALFKFACLPYETYINLDAIVRSTWRQCVSKKLLLQWNPSDNSYNESLVRVGPLARRMWIGPVLAVVMTSVLRIENRELILPYALPLFALWLISPLFASWLSQPVKQRVETLDAKQTAFLRRSARRIWLFFEDFVTARENWLPPDNYQEYPEPKIAHRTSPTNMGLSLLANLSAYDFGYVTGGTLLMRCEKSIGAMLKMERHRGHFYNWYDTRSLEILKPAYISTVDSGNLAAHLMVLASGVRAVPAARIVDSRVFAGLLDTVELAAEQETRTSWIAPVPLKGLRAKLSELAQRKHIGLSDMYKALKEVEEEFNQFRAKWKDDALDFTPARTTTRWQDAFVRQCGEAVREIETLAPWAGLLPEHEEWAENRDFNRIPSLNHIHALARRVEEAAATGDAGQAPIDGELAKLVTDAAAVVEQRLATIREIQIHCEDLSNIEFGFLYDESKRLLSIGYNVEERRLDSAFYDLLASEARLTSYLGVAQHKIPQASWFALGRMLTLSRRRPLLVSWSGSMFEYLMPLLVMPTYANTLLDETYRAVVSIQLQYGESKGVPWGISESGYNVFDSEHNYQYRAFGVPELGLKHGLSDDLVIAPYASALSVMVYPSRACKNLERLAADHCQTIYGFYEAVDYTQSRVPHGKNKAIIRSHMAHHQGMSMVAFGQALFGNIMHKRFESDSVLNSATLLLQEMAPAEKAMYFHSIYTPEIRPATISEEAPNRILQNPNPPHPEIQLLSNGSYNVMITSAGGGYSRRRDIAVTRWREDPVRDNWGQYCYIRDADTDRVWSNTYQPTCVEADHYEAVFSEGKAEYTRKDHEFATHTEVIVSPEDDVEVRRIRIANRSVRRKTIDVTTFGEVVLAAPAADDSHQAFSKLFIQTHIRPEQNAIVCSRRPRSKTDETPLMFHMLANRSELEATWSYETDRLRFVGRDNDASRPEAIFCDTPALSGSDGAVLDPIVAIRARVTIEPGEHVVFDMMTGVADDEAALSALMEKYHEQRTADKAFDLAWSHGQLLLRQLNASETEAQRYTQLASSIVYMNPVYRADPSILVKNRKGQSGLWGYAISGDLPIVLLKIEDPDRIKIVNQLIQAHTYWRQKGLKVDLVIWNEDKSGYRQSLHDQIIGLAGAALHDSEMEKPGGIFIRSPDRIADEDRVLIQSAARISLSDADGMLDEQVRRQQKNFAPSSTTAIHYLPERMEPAHSSELPRGRLILDNRYGGFSPDGREYVVHMDDAVTTPLPWVNVMANASFGTVISNSGSACTWAENAHEFRLTPWTNDPVTDNGGEALYLRDEQAGEYWSPTPFPCGGGGYTARHGFGYSVFDHKRMELYSETTVFVDAEDPVKYVMLKVRNDSAGTRNLSATSYAEWVLGDLPHKTNMHIVTGVDSVTGALLARNHYNDDFRGRTAFLDTDDPGRTVCGNRREFIGRNGALADPLVLRRANLSGRVGPGFDPCGSVQVKFTLLPGQERTIVFRMGSARYLDATRRLINACRGIDHAHRALDGVKSFWNGILNAIQVETPDPAFDVMANGWLLYQTLSCRFWGRNATYQSGGAFGFRDQLQDSMALLYSRPDLVRAHIKLSAAHQFLEGDVMHWWHPPVGRGVRTHCSDDYLWLPYVTERYLAVTSDESILGEEVGFLTGGPVPEGDESYYDLPGRSDEKASLYEHCKRSILHGMRYGEHGLPLIGSGDWNDGMDMIGREGKGESVWLGFFLYSTLIRFVEVARKQNDPSFVDLCEREAGELKKNLDVHGWDDNWYRRAYFDDGTPLGSAQSPECRIDSIAQSWSVISGAGEEGRTKSAMRELFKQLVDQSNKIIRLFTPAFDKSDLNPGYIKGYVPGVRENGGQYTHAAIWAAMAFAQIGDSAKAWLCHDIINPVKHSLSDDEIDIYKVEPYVVSADVYAAEKHAGRGGWSWYTGSASWLYRFMLESILGFSLTDGSLKLTPCVPSDWEGFKIHYRRGCAVFTIEVRRDVSVAQGTEMEIDGRRVEFADVPLLDDAKNHHVLIRIAHIEKNTARLTRVSLGSPKEPVAARP